MVMKSKKNIVSWVSIAVAVASAVGIVFMPDQKTWFLVILLLNLVVSALFNKQYVKNPLTVCRLLVGALFIFSSFTKGVDPLGTKYKMLDYCEAYHLQWLDEAAMVLAVLLILAEFLIGICLLTNVCPKVAAIGGGVFMLMFTTVTLFDALYNMVPDCGCFGTAIKMTNWQTFYKNLVIDAVLLPLLLNIKTLKCRLDKRLQFIIGLAYAALFTGFEIYNYRHLPVVDFMNWKVGNQMKKPETELKVYLTYRNKETNEVKEYLSPDYPWQDSVWRSQWEFVDQRTEGGKEYIGFNAWDSFGNDVTDSILSIPKFLMFTSHDMTKITEKEWEKIKNITEEAEKAGFSVAMVASEYRSDLDAYQEQYPFMKTIYSGDELEIKTIVRFNPGLVYLDDGLVVNKWSAIDFPQGKKLNKLLGR